MSSHSLTHCNEYRPTDGDEIQLQPCNGRVWAITDIAIHPKRKFVQNIGYTSACETHLKSLQERLTGLGHRVDVSKQPFGLIETTTHRGPESEP